MHSPEIQGQQRFEETLDPQDWTAAKTLGHRMLEEMFDYLATIRTKRAWQPALKEPATRGSALPIEGTDLTRIYDEFKRDILPFAFGNAHPRFWALVSGTGSASGVLAEMLIATLNSPAVGGNQVAVRIEQQVIEWMKQALGYAPDASGLLVTGGSMANLIGLTVARNTRAGWDVKRHGLTEAGSRLRLYCSTETHSSVRKAVELIGLGSDAIRLIPVTPEFQIDIGELRKTIAADRKHGLKPFCVVATAGTVNTGAIDDLQGIANICEREGLWFHVDGAFGALVRLSPKLAALVNGLERADSIAFDLHKWLYMPYDIGCVLVRHKDEHLATFDYQASYLEPSDRGLLAGDTWFSRYGVELSRSFRALKAWMLLKEFGTAKLGRLIEQNCRQGKYLADLVNRTEGFELLAPVPLNLVCFRSVPREVRGERLNDFNRELLIRLQESGVAAPSSTILNDKYAIRVAITNHRSRHEDFDLLISELQKMVAEMLRASDWS